MGSAIEELRDMLQDNPKALGLAIIVSSTLERQADVIGKLGAAMAQQERLYTLLERIATAQERVAEAQERISGKLQAAYEKGWGE